MALPTVKKQILSDLDRLSPEQQQRAAQLVHGLVAGTLDDQAAGKIVLTMEAGRERADLDEWSIIENLPIEGW
jgi:hypothetical protein